MFNYSDLGASYKKSITSAQRLKSRKIRGLTQGIAEHYSEKCANFLICYSISDGQNFF